MHLLTTGEEVFIPFVCRRCGKCCREVSISSAYFVDPEVQLFLNMGAREVIERIGAALADLPCPAGPRDEFERLALAELALAGRMDMLAARRAIAGGMLRAGQMPPAAELNALADETAEVSGEFQSLWLARSKPSRLADNVAKLDAAVAESRRLAKY